MALFIIFLFIIQPAEAVNFVDTVGHLHEAETDVLYEHGIVEGYGGGIFRPDIAINRAEFLKILMLAVYGDEPIDVNDVRCFSDFTGEPQWFWAHACNAKKKGVISGYPDGTFRGQYTVNLAEALKIASLAWNIPVEQHTGEPEFWYVPYFAVAAQRGLFDFFPRIGSHLLTRSDMAYLIVHMDLPIAYVNKSTLATNPSTVPAPDPDLDLDLDLDPLPTPRCGDGVVQAGEECDDGNLENGDGCSEICVIVEQPVHHASLRIVQQPSSAQTITAGQNDVILMAMDAVAGRQDVRITSLVFEAIVGSANLANTYSLHIDTDADGTVDSVAGTASAQGNTVTFNSLNMPVMDGRIHRLELRGDIVSNLGSQSLEMGFKTSDPRFVIAVGQVDGRDLTGIELNGGDCQQNDICWIAVYTQTLQPSTPVVSRGNLYVTASNTPVRSKQLLGGKESEELMRITLRSDGEDVLVEQMAFQDLPGSVKQLTLHEAGSSLAFASTYATSCGTVVSGRQCAEMSLTVPANQEKTISVHALIKSDNERVTSGDTVRIVLKDAHPTLAAIEAVGQSSQEDLDRNNGDTNADGEIFVGTASAGANADITSAEHTVTLAKIMSIQNVNADSDGSAVPTGTATFGVFRFLAAEHGNSNGGLNTVALEKLIFTVNATNVEFLNNSFKLVNMVDPSLQSSCSNSGNTGNITVTCDNIDSSSILAEIDQGGYIDLGLQGMVLNASVGNGSSTLQASLQNIVDPASSTAVQWTDGETSLQWVDLDITSVSSTQYR